MSVRAYGMCQWLLYEHINFEGLSYIMSQDSYSTPSNWNGTLNRISSARVLPPQGTKAIVMFEHINYRGRMVVLYKSNSDLSALDFNDQLSSFIITGGEWTIYEHINFQGESATSGPVKYRYTSTGGALGKAGVNDFISSIKAI